MPKPTNLPDLAEVLAEVNRLRCERGGKPLARMPKGYRMDGNECPLACAFGTQVGLSSIHYSDGPVNLPDPLCAFRSAFDAGLYPDLVA